jgi:S1-C subfamily serine protease
MQQNNDPFNTSSYNSYYQNSFQQRAHNTATLEAPTAPAPQRYQAQTSVYGPPSSYEHGSPTQYTTPQPIKRPKGGLRTGALLVLTFVLLVVFGVGLFAGWEFSASGKAGTTAAPVTTTSSNSPALPQTQTEAAIAKIEPAVVQLDVVTAQGGQLGSGVIVDNKGDIITNNHVIDGGTSIKAVLNNGKTEVAQLIGTDPAHDLAVVRIQPFADMVVATISDSSKLAVGQEVLVVGNPLGITETATHGIVSALNRSVTEPNGATIKDAVQTDAPINPGNSGGALVTLDGELVGIPTLSAVDGEFNTPASGVGFAIPSGQVKTTLAQILQQAGK